MLLITAHHCGSVQRCCSFVRAVAACGASRAHGIDSVMQGTFRTHAARSLIELQPHCINLLCTDYAYDTLAALNCAVSDGRAAETVMRVVGWAQYVAIHDLDLGLACLN